MMRHQHKRPHGALVRSKPASKGKAYRRIIGKLVTPGREYFLHATKGYRSFRAAP
jgi:hypothetical protein